MTRPVLPVLARFALASYPAWWRERYGEDQATFLEDLARDGRPLRRAVTNLAFGALRVRLQPAGMPRTFGAWRDRTRASIAWATVPAVAGMLLIVVIERHSFRNSMFPSLSTGGRVAADAMMTIEWASVALLLLLLAGWGLVGGLADRVPGGRQRRRWLWLTTAPLAVAAVEIGLAILQDKFMPNVTLSNGATAAGHPLAYTIVSIAYDAVAVAGILSILGVVVAARAVDYRITDLRGGVRVAQLTAAVMSLSAVASVAWGIGVTHQPPIPASGLRSSFAVARAWTGIQTSMAADWPLVSAGLVAVSIVTALASVSARRSYRATQALAVLDG